MTTSDRLRQLREAAYAPRPVVARKPRGRERKVIPRTPKPNARRGSEKDPAYRTWMHRTFGCLVAGKRADSPCGTVRTLHHLRHRVKPDGTIERTGRIDKRTVVLCECHHQTGPQAIHVLTGQGQWEAFFGVDLEAAVRRCNEMYEEAKRSGQAGNEPMGTAV